MVGSWSLADVLRSDVIGVDGGAVRMGGLSALVWPAVFVGGAPGVSGAADVLGVAILYAATEFDAVMLLMGEIDRGEAFGDSVDKLFVDVILVVGEFIIGFMVNFVSKFVVVIIKIIMTAIKIMAVKIIKFKFVIVMALLSFKIVDNNRTVVLVTSPSSGIASSVLVRCRRDNRYPEERDTYKNNHPAARPQVFNH